MKKTSYLFALPVLVLVSCGGNSDITSSSANEESSTIEEIDTSSLNIICPTGIPSLAFYDQGANKNFVTSVATSIPANFASSGENSYDAIVFDGIGGLNNIALNNRDYALAKWISGGTFYVVSTKHTKDESFNQDSTINGFVKTGIASLSFMKLAKDNWNWGDYSSSNKITFSDAVSDVRNNLVTNPDGFDYYIVAEPVLTASRAALAAKGVALNVIYNIQEEWASYYDGAIVPAAGLFINKNAYSSKKKELDQLLEDVDFRITEAIDRPQIAVDALTTYENVDPNNDNDCETRFGFTPALVSSLQKDGANKFNLVKGSSVSDIKAVANSFRSILGQAEFPETAFLTK